MTAAHLRRLAVSLLKATTALLLATLVLFRGGAGLFLARVDLHQVETTLTAWTALDAHVGGIGTDWTGLVLLKDVKLSHAGRTILECPVVGLRLAFWQLTSQPDLLYLQLESPTLACDDAVIAWLQDHWRGRPPLQAPVRVVVQNGNVAWSAYPLHSVDAVLKVSQDSVPFRIRGTDDQGGQYSVRGLFDTSGFHLTGHVRNVSPGLADVRLTGPISISHQAGSPLQVQGNLQVASRAFSGTIEASVGMAAGTTLSGAIHSPAGTILGRMAYRDLQLTVSGGHGTWSITGGQVSVGSQTVFLSGRRESNGQVQGDLKGDLVSATLRGAWPHLDLTVEDGAWTAELVQTAALTARVHLTGAPPGLTAAVDGDLRWSTGNVADVHVASFIVRTSEGNAQGTADLHYAAGACKGTVTLPTVQIGPRTFATQITATQESPSAAVVTGQLTGTDLDGGITLDGRWDSGSGTSLTLTWKRRKTLQAHLDMQGDIIHVEAAVPNFLPSIPAIPIHGTLDLDDRQIDLQAVFNGFDPGLMGSLLGWDLPTLRGNVYGTVSAKGPLGSAVLGFDGYLEHSGLGRLGFATNENHLSVVSSGAVRLDVQKLPLQDLAIAKVLLPSRTGTGNLHLVFRPRHAPVQFSLEVPVGLVNGTLIRQGPLLHMSQVSLWFPIGEPPVHLAGVWDEGEGTVMLLGTVRGEDLATVAKALPGFPPGVLGQVEGSFLVRGPLGDAHWTVSAQGSHLSLAGTPIGSAHLEADLMAGSDGFHGDVTVTHLDPPRLKLLHQHVPGPSNSSTLTATLNGRKTPALRFR